MNVRFSGSNDVYTLKVEVHGKNTVRLYPPEDGFSNVDLASGFELLTREKGGKVFGDYLDYTTVYGKLEDGSVILSNDGSVYVPPEEIEQIPDEDQYIPTLEQVKEWKNLNSYFRCFFFFSYKSSPFDVFFYRGTINRFRFIYSSNIDGKVRKIGILMKG